MKRLKSGIDGLDALIEGGIPEGFSVLVSGTPGSCKTIFALQYINKGLEEGEPGIFITFEQSRNDIVMQAKEFGWDFEKYEKSGNLKIISMWPQNFDTVLTKINELRKETYFRRIAIDSITNVILNGTTDRELIHSVMSKLKELGMTAIMTSELLEGGKGLSRDGVSEFVADGVIVLTLQEALDTRKMQVRKMRSTSHTLKPQLMEITDRGLRVGKQ